MFDTGHYALNRLVVPERNSWEYFFGALRWGASSLQLKKDVEPKKLPQIFIFNFQLGFAGFFCFVFYVVEQTLLS